MKRSLTKSTLAFARVACQVAQESLPAYSSPKSPHLYTQHQLFALLALRIFLKSDYRGILQTLSEWSDLRKVLRLRKNHLPDHSTLVKAQKRLLKKTDLKACLERLPVSQAAQE
jgi:hypothetical protein